MAVLVLVVLQVEDMTFVNSFNPPRVRGPAFLSIRLHVVLETGVVGTGPTFYYY